MKYAVIDAVTEHVRFLSDEVPLERDGKLMFQDFNVLDMPPGATVAEEVEDVIPEDFTGGKYKMKNKKFELDPEWVDRATIKAAQKAADQAAREARAAAKDAYEKEHGPGTYPGPGEVE